jgi:hypothetical protein
MNYKATSLTFLASVSQDFMILKLPEQVKSFWQYNFNISPLTNGTHTHTHTLFNVDYITSELQCTSRKGKENCYTTV